MDVLADPMLAKGWPQLVFRRKLVRYRQCWPRYLQSWVVVANSAFGILMVKVVTLVIKDGRLAQHQVTVRKAAGHQQLSPILSRQHGTKPFAVGL